MLYRRHATTAPVLLLCGLAWLPPSSSRADTTLKFRATGDGAPTSIQVTRSKVRMESGGAQQGYMVFDRDTSSMIAVDTQNRQYFIVDQQTLVQLSSALSALPTGMLKQMQNQLKHLPPEQRAMAERQMKKMMGGKTPAKKLRLVDSRKTARVAGVKCAVHRLQRAGKNEGTMCLASPSSLGISAAEQKSLAAMFDFFTSMARGGGMMQNTMEDFLIESLKDRVPIRVSKGGKVDSELVSVNHDRISAARLQPPKGYKKSKMPNLNTMPSY